MTLAFFDIDTQRDFMEPDGKLYVPGSEKILELLDRITLYAIYNGYQILGSVDKHSPFDEELAEFPEHCMDGYTGQQKVPFTTVRNSLFIEDAFYIDFILDKMLSKKYTGIYMEKSTTDIFTNRHADTVLKALNITDAIVYGVVAEICVHKAVQGLLDRDIRVIVVEDAVIPLDAGKYEESKGEWIERGVRLLNWEKVKQVI